MKIFTFTSCFNKVLFKFKINLSKEIERVTRLDSVENIVYLIIFKGHRVFELVVILAGLTNVRDWFF